MLGGMRSFVFVALAACSLCVGCGASQVPLAKSAPRETVRSAAAERFQCPVNRVGVRHTGGGRFMARGCGQIDAWICSLPNGEGAGQCVTESRAFAAK
jgi:hypothetical protein